MDISGARTGRFSTTFRLLAAFVCFCFFNEIITTDILRWQPALAYAQTDKSASLVLPSSTFSPPALKAIHISPDVPLDIDFIIDSADDANFKQQDARLLIQYFLAVMTTPEKDLWVNLSPYESQRVIVPEFGQTAAGRDLLAQDNLLKQLAASLTYPEGKTGKNFWDKVHQKAFELYGTADMPVDTFARIWIVPDHAVVYEYEGTAFVEQSRLKVLLEEDYLALKNAQGENGKVYTPSDQAQKVNSLSAMITQEVILPEIEKEINEGKNFVPLRQVFNALILATWYKKRLREGWISHQYVDQKKIMGIQDSREETTETIYDRYLQGLKQGVYNYIREDFDEDSQSLIPRQYFSGGFSVGDSDQWLSIRKISTLAISLREFFAGLGKKLVFAKVRLQPFGKDGVATLLAPKRNQKRFTKSISALLLAGSLWGVSFSAAATLLELEHPAMFQDSVVAVQQNNVNKPVHLQSVLTTKLTAIERIKKQVSVEDVIALDGQVNAQTKKPYKIDRNYFKRNWGTILTRGQISWVKQVLVIAYQHKMGLQEDGQIGPNTVAALEQSNQAQPLTFAVEQSRITLNNLPDIDQVIGSDFPLGDNLTLGADRISSIQPAVAVSGFPPPEDDNQDISNLDLADTSLEPVSILQNQSWETNLGNYFQQIYSFLFEGLLTVLIGLQTFRIVQDYKKGSTDRREFLKFLTKYLQGQKDHWFSNIEPVLISKNASLNDMSAKIVGHRFEVTIRSGNSLRGWGIKDQRQLTHQMIQKILDGGDLRVMSGEHILRLKKIRRSATRMELVFTLPSKAKMVSKAITIYYRAEGKTLKNFQLSVSEDAFEELENEWEEIVKKDSPINENQLADLVKAIGIYRQENPPLFKDFRTKSVVAFKMRKLALAVLRRTKRDGSIGQSYRDYFYCLASYANMMRYLLAQSGTLDSFKSSFLPESDSLNFKIFGLSLDKIYRVATLVEHAYLRVQKNVKESLPKFYNYQKTLDYFEAQLHGDSDQDGDDRDQELGINYQKKEYTAGTLLAEFDQFSMSLEKPYAHSIVGLDLFRRHGKVLRSIKEILFLFSPLILWLAFGSSFSVWIPSIIGISTFFGVNYAAPKLSDIWVKCEFNNFSRILSEFSPEQKLEDFASPVLNKNKLLEYLSQRFLTKTQWSRSPFVLVASQFSDVKAIRENSYVEIRLISNSHFMTDNGKGEAVIAQVKQAISSGTLAFRMALAGALDDITLDRVIVCVHPTGIRIRIKNVDVKAESIEFHYNGEQGNSRKAYILPIINDSFKQLINQWDHFLDEAHQGNLSGLDALIVAIRQFYKPDNINLTDFRKNAGFYHLIREWAFATYGALVIKGNSQGVVYRQYFLELARYATEVRFLSANFAGMDALKSWYLPDGEFFNYKIFGLPIARILRAIFGVSFLYSWVRADTLKSITRVVQQWETLDQISIKSIGERRIDNKMGQAIRRKLLTQFEKADFAFRYPVKNSLGGSDKYSRIFGMSVMSGFFVTLVLTLGAMSLPALVSGINILSMWFVGEMILPTSHILLFLNTPHLLGLSIVNFSVVFYLIAYWINPIHGNNAMQRERNMYLSLVDSYQKNLSHGEMKIIQTKQILNSIWSQAFYYLSYVLGIFSPVVVMGYFLYQQIQSKFWNNNFTSSDGTGEESLLSPTDIEKNKDVVAGDPLNKAQASSVLINQNPGGIDLGTTNPNIIRGQKSSLKWTIDTTSDILIPDIEGMDFQILEMTPILNLPNFMPNFVQGHSPQQVISLNSP
jgi:hypothetical protein